MFTPYLLSVALSLAAANPILQRIPIQIPGQTYPVPSCPTCPTQTCPTQTCPTCPAQSCPALSRPSCQACQNPYQNLNPRPMLVQSGNNCPCNLPVTAQNPIVNPLNQDTLHELILRRLLSSPMHGNPAAVKTCTQCDAQKSPPNIINNYIIIPPEYFKNETKVDKDESVQRKRKGTKRKQSRQRNQQAGTPCPCEDNDELNNDKITVDRDVTPCPYDKEDTSKPGDVKIQDLNNQSKIKTAPTNDKIMSENNRELSDQEVYSDKNKVTTKKPKRRNREETKSLEEAIIKDFCRKNPSIPKEIAKCLLKNLKQQVESRSYSHYRPYPYSPFGYGPYNPQMFYPQFDEYEEIKNDRVKNNRGSRRRDSKRRSGRRNKKTKEVINENTGSSDKKSENAVEISPNVINIEKEIITTEKITTTEKQIEDLAKDSETQMETPDDLLEQLDKMKAKFAKLNEIETTTVSYNKRIEQYPELGNEDKVPTVYNNGVDDYYPDFRGDNIAFYASDEECDVNEEPDSKRYVTKKSNIINNDSNKEVGAVQSIPVSTESYEMYEESIKDESGEVRFRVPPHLEIPDFETRQINRFSQEIYDKFVTDDSVSYSNAKAVTRKPEIMKPAKVFTKDKSGRTNIETVFGRSRVVKYGQDAEAAGSEPVITYYLPEEAMTEDRIQLPDGERVVVVAKSIRDIEDWQ